MQSLQEFQRACTGLELFLMRDIPLWVPNMRFEEEEWNVIGRKEITVYVSNESELLLRCAELRRKDYHNQFLIEADGKRGLSLMHILSMFSKREGYQITREEVVLPAAYKAYFISWTRKIPNPQKQQKAP